MARGAVLSVKIHVSVFVSMLCSWLVLSFLMVLILFKSQNIVRALAVGMAVLFGGAQQ